MKQELSRVISGFALSVVFGHSLPLAAIAETSKPGAIAPTSTPGVAVPTPQAAEPTTAPVLTPRSQTAPDTTPVLTPRPTRNMRPSPTADDDLPTGRVINPYTLGAGDVVRVEMFETPELALQPQYTVLVDGTLNLPWIGNVSVQGLSLTQAADRISERYNEFIRDPLITVSLVVPRPLKVGIIGEVNRPGSYIMSLISRETAEENPVQTAGGQTGNQWPTVSRAIQTAGGITQFANIRQIEIRRPLGDGEQAIIKLDLWKFLQDGDLSQDVQLRDGDVVFVAKATSDLPPEEATKVAVSNFSPALIKVQVVGEVVNPGAVEIRPNSTLNQAIFAAGGLQNERALKSRVELIRLNPNGTLTRREIRLDFSKGVDEDSNPAVYNNDVIVVNRNVLARVSDSLGAVLNPINAFFGFVRIFGLDNND